MSKFKDKIRAAGGKVEFFYNPANRSIATQISGFGFIALYQVAVSMDGRALLSTVPATGIGVTPVYPQPSVLTFIQSDEEGMWGRNCPRCEKYFRTTHITDVTFCPYCWRPASSLDFISKAQRTYIVAFYDAFMRAHLYGTNTSLDLADVTDATDITDATPPWHYEVKQQYHFTCDAKDCGTRTDLLGEYGFCPRCGRTNARIIFFAQMDKMSADLETAARTVTDRDERAELWGKAIVNSVHELEPLAKHLRERLFGFPMTLKRRKQLGDLSFQQPLEAGEALSQWFDISLVEWRGDGATHPRKLTESDLPFIRKMLQNRHILIHNKGVVDQNYLDRGGDQQFQLRERIRIRSNEARRFIALVRIMGANLMDNVENQDFVRGGS